MHDMGLLSRLVSDLLAQRPDHVMMTGDVVNIGLPAEIAAAREWLAESDVAALAYSAVTFSAGIACRKMLSTNASSNAMVSVWKRVTTMKNGWMHRIAFGSIFVMSAAMISLAQKPAAAIVPRSCGSIT